MLLALAGVWGTSFIFVSVAVRTLPPFTVVVSRVGLAAIALNLLLAGAGISMPRNLRAWGAMALMGVLNNALPYCLIVWGQTHIPSGLAAILISTVPLFTLVVAHFLTHDEKMTRLRVAGVMVGFTGIVFMIGFDALHHVQSQVLAQVAVLGGACSYAFAGVLARRFRHLGISPLVMSTGQVTCSSVMLLPLVVLVDRPWTLPVPGLGTIGALLGLALMCTAFAYVLYYRILTSAGAVNVALVTFLAPVNTIILGILFLHETLHPEDLAGMLLIGAGLALIDGRLWRRLRGS
jgi:drug/metabolite transporter (DMT)-like permease